MKTSPARRGAAALAVALTAAGAGLLATSAQAAPSANSVAQIDVVQGPYGTWVESSKELSNIVYIDCDGNLTKLDGLTGTTLELPADLETVWVKSGSYQSGDGPGYGQRFDFDCDPYQPS